MVLNKIGTSHFGCSHAFGKNIALNELNESNIKIETNLSCGRPTFDEEKDFNNKIKLKWNISVGYNVGTIIQAENKCIYRIVDKSVDTQNDEKYFRKILKELLDELITETINEVPFDEPRRIVLEAIALSHRDSPIKEEYLSLLQTLTYA
ncbi:hypothetical protein [Aquipluma nitroreducens]|uniref:hypothetical protein n=1 Tax=Aquipluma nitroreducens TaxID=2010828 RepID=UPI00296F72C7|nr:hypothetical protein [Aquipluma nitroreducens]